MYLSIMVHTLRDGPSNRFVTAIIAPIAAATTAAIVSATVALVGCWKVACCSGNYFT